MANEKWLANAEAIERKLKKVYCAECNVVRKVQCSACWVEDVLELLEGDTVDDVEVVHGRWKYYHKQNKAVCTNCSFERDLDVNFGRAISCPNCGAKMDGDWNA